MNPNAKDKAKECCRREHQKLKDHLDHCDAAAQNENQRHHCYRHAAWHSGHQARRCIAGNQS